MAEAPQRMTLTDVETGETVPVQFNPLNPTVELEAFYNRLKVPGAAGERMQFSNSSNMRVAFELLYDGLSKGAPDLDKVQGILLSFALPPDAVQNVDTGAPPRLLMVWPSWISIVSRMPKIKLMPKRFAADGRPTYMHIGVELESNRSARLGAQSMRRGGMRRTS